MLEQIPPSDAAKLGMIRANAIEKIEYILRIANASELPVLLEYVERAPDGEADASPGKERLREREVLLERNHILLQRTRIIVHGDLLSPLHRPCVRAPYHTPHLRQVDV